MARDNMSSTQVVIAKNQVFLAERILRSIGSVLSGSDQVPVLQQTTLMRILKHLVRI